MLVEGQLRLDLLVHFKQFARTLLAENLLLRFPVFVLLALFVVLGVLVRQALLLLFVGVLLVALVRVACPVLVQGLPFGSLLS